MSELSFQGAASFNFMAADTVQSDFGAPKLKFATVSISPSSICHEVMGLDVKIFVFYVEFQVTFSSPFSPSSRGSFVPLHFLPLDWYHLHIWGSYFSWQSWFQLVICPAWHLAWCTLHIGLPRWLSDKRIHLQYRRQKFYPWIGNRPWRRKWQHISVFLPRKSHGQQSLVGYSLLGYKIWTEWLNNISACKLNKQDDNIQPCHTPFTILSQSDAACLVLAVTSCPTYRFLRIQVKYLVLSSLRIFPQFIVIPVKGFSLVNETEVDAFLETDGYSGQNDNILEFCSICW